MVGGDGVQGAVKKPLQEGLPVLFPPEGRGHLEEGVKGPQGLLGEGEVVGGGLRGHGEARALRLPDELQAPLRGKVLDVEPGGGRASP